MILPMWANLLFIAAIMVLIGLSVSKRINLKERFSTAVEQKAKSGYYIIATIVMVIETIGFFLLSPMQELSGIYLGFIGVITFLAFLVAVFGCMDSDNKKRLLLSVGGMYGLIIVLVTLIFCNLIYAAIWVVSLISLGFIRHILFPAKE